MANLIITIISIALVAVAALMGAYYGGRAFLEGRIKAYATTLAQQGQQIVSAWTLYATNNGGNWAIANTAALAPTYLASVPIGPRDALYDEGSSFPWVIENLDDLDSVDQSTFNGAYVMLVDNDVGRAVCAMVATMTAGPAATPTKLAASATDILTTDRKFDCAFTSYSGGVGAFPEPGDYMYVYYRAR